MSRVTPLLNQDQSNNNYISLDASLPENYRGAVALRRGRLNSAPSKLPANGDKRTVDLDLENRFVALTQNDQTLQAYLVASQYYDAKKGLWVIDKIIARELTLYSKTPPSSARTKKPDSQFGYERSRRYKEATVKDKAGKVITDPKEAVKRVREMLEHGGLTLNTAEQVQYAQGVKKKIENYKKQNPPPPLTYVPNTQFQGTGVGGKGLPALGGRYELPQPKKFSDYLPRMQYALQRAAEWAGPVLAEQLKGMASPQGAAMFAALLGLSITPAGPAINAALVVLGGADFAKGMLKLMSAVLYGDHVDDLNQGGKEFAQGLSGAVMNVVMGGLMRLTGKAVPAFQSALNDTQAIRKVLDAFAHPQDLGDVKQLLLFLMDGGRGYRLLPPAIKTAVHEGLIASQKIVGKNTAQLDVITQALIKLKQLDGQGTPTQKSLPPSKVLHNRPVTKKTVYSKKGGPLVSTRTKGKPLASRQTGALSRKINNHPAVDANLANLLVKIDGAVVGIRAQPRSKVALNKLMLICEALDNLRKQALVAGQWTEAQQRIFQQKMQEVSDAGDYIRLALEGTKNPTFLKPSDLNTLRTIKSISSDKSNFYIPKILPHSTRPNPNFRRTEDHLLPKGRLTKNPSSRTDVKIEPKKEPTPNKKTSTPGINTDDAIQKEIELANTLLADSNFMKILGGDKRYARLIARILVSPQGVNESGHQWRTRVLYKSGLDLTEAQIRGLPTQLKRFSRDSALFDSNELDDFIKNPESLREYVAKFTVNHVSEEKRGLFLPPAESSQNWSSRIEAILSTLDAKSNVATALRVYGKMLKNPSKYNGVMSKFENGVYKYDLSTSSTYSSLGYNGYFEMRLTSTGLLMLHYYRRMKVDGHGPVENFEARINLNNLKSVKKIPFEIESMLRGLDQP